VTRPSGRAAIAWSSLKSCSFSLSSTTAITSCSISFQLIRLRGSSRCSAIGHRTSDWQRDYPPDGGCGRLAC
jgi:hypothetical protein